MSDLYLDTEVRDGLPRLALEMLESDFDLPELEQIFKFEVTPVVYTNMLQVAGEWAGFDDTWLFQAIRAHLPRTLERLQRDPKKLAGQYRKQGLADKDWQATLGFYGLLQTLAADARAGRIRVWAALARCYFGPHIGPQIEQMLHPDSPHVIALRESELDLERVFADECETIFRTLLVARFDPKPEQAQQNVRTAIAFAR